jgi:1-deoxy-D-xylulose-5-phosphate reductoisomerase
MNKGLELIEAMHLFSVRPGQIRVIIHPESIIHSMVEFIDGSVVAQLGKPDMSLPIRYALCYPNREQGKLEAPDFTSLWKLTFREPDLESFPCLTLAVDCAKKGGTCPAVLNAANEEAVEGFLTGRLNFGRIYETAAAAVDALGRAGAISLEEIRDVDEQARRYVRENMQ